MSQAKINPNCPCTSSCSRHGDCVECRKHHSITGTSVYCERHLVKDNS